MACVAKEHFHIDDYASDALALRLASESVVKKLLHLEIADTGNKMVSPLIVDVEIQFILGIICCVVIGYFRLLPFCWLLFAYIWLL